MIYLDTSVALAWMLGEDRHPPEAFWQRQLVTSRLLEYELWTRLRARGGDAPTLALADDLLSRLLILELVPPVLDRVRAGFPVQVRTLDAIHLSTALYLAGQRQSLTLASYDERLLAAGASVGLRLADDIG